MSITERKWKLTPLPNVQVFKGCKKENNLFVVPFLKTSDESVFQRAFNSFVCDWSESRIKDIENVVSGSSFKGNYGEFLSIYPLTKKNHLRVLFVGLGETNKLTTDKIRKLGIKVVEEVSKYKAESFSTYILGNLDVHNPLDLYLQATIEGLLLGAYKFSSFKAPPKEGFKGIKNIKIINVFPIRDVAEKICKETIATMEAVYLARDLVNAPPNVLDPAEFVEEAYRLVDLHPQLRLTWFDHNKLKEKGFGLLTAVAQGSPSGARLVVLEYKPENAKKFSKPVVLVAKGITFDTGGLDLKPTGAMLDMKKDMAGAAAVFGAVKAIAESSFPANIVAIIPLAENKTGAGAYRPGDILTAYNGIKVEIVNTDGEGRLILADALAFAHTFNPRYIIDLATLTGAMIMGLGCEWSGMFSNDDNLARSLFDAGLQSGELLWRMPFTDDDSRIKSEIADVNHLGKGSVLGIKDGMSLNAALFLRKFVKDVPWVHIDMAGPGICKESVGWGVRLLVEFLNNIDVY